MPPWLKRAEIVTKTDLTLPGKGGSLPRLWSRSRDSWAFPAMPSLGQYPILPSSRILPGGETRPLPSSPPHSWHQTREGVLHWEAGKGHCCFFWRKSLLLWLQTEMQNALSNSEKKSPRKVWYLNFFFGQILVHTILKVSIYVLYPKMFISLKVYV